MSGGADFCERGAYREMSRFTRVSQAVASRDGGGLCRVLLVLLGFEVGAGVGYGFPLCGAC